MSGNPYQAPAVAEVVAAKTDAETMRRKYLSHEVSVKGVGNLFVLCGVLGGIGLMSMLAGVASGGSAREILVLALCGGIGVLQFIAGLGLRKFTRAGRIRASIIAAIWLIGFPIGMLASIAGPFDLVPYGVSLIGFPIGTVIGAYVLYLLLGAKGKAVFSPEYQAVIAEAPQIRHRTSKWVWIILLLFLGLMFAALFTGGSPAP